MTMVFYWLQLIQFNGMIYNDIFSFTHSSEEIRKRFYSYRTDLYAEAIIKEAHLSVEEAIALIINHNNELKASIMAKVK